MEDWLLYLKSVEGKYGDEFELSQLSPGDVLKVVTQHADDTNDDRHSGDMLARP
jgi:hypothetical protein